MCFFYLASLIVTLDRWLDECSRHVPPVLCQFGVIGMAQTIAHCFFGQILTNRLGQIDAGLVGQANQYE